MPPIKVKFEIPYFTVSGIQVRAWLAMLGRARLCGWSCLRACCHKPTALAGSSSPRPSLLPAPQVRYLKVIEKSGYTALPWVRYLCVAGDNYEIRTAAQF